MGLNDSPERGETSCGERRMTIPQLVSRLFQQGSVPKENWSEKDQKRMSRGELPQGYPIHDNV